MTQSSLLASDLGTPEMLSACLDDQREPKHNVLSIYPHQQVIKAWGIPADFKVLEIGPCPCVCKLPPPEAKTSASHHPNH